MLFRSLLDTVYNFSNNFLDKKYVDDHAGIIKKQLLIGGLRLASVLKECFTNSVSNNAAFNDMENNLRMYNLMMRVLLS